MTEAQSYEYMVPYQGKQYKVISDHAMTPAEQQAHVLRRLGMESIRPTVSGEQPSLTEGPYPGVSLEAPEPERRPEMPWYARAPLEVGLPLVAGMVAGSMSGPAAPGVVPLVSGGAQLLGNELNKRLLADALGFAPPKPAFSNEPMREAALQFGAGVAAEAIPGAAMAGIRRMVTGRTPANASRTLEAFQETGVQPKMTDLAEGRFPAMMESVTRQTLTGAPIIDKTIRTQAEQLTTAAQEFTSNLGPLLAQSEQATGQSVKSAIMSGLERGKALQKEMWEALADLGKDVKITPTTLVQWADEVMARGETGLETVQDKSSRALAEEILKKSTTGKGLKRTIKALPFEQADTWRKDIGQTLDKPELISGFDQGRLRHGYHLLLDDIEEGISQSNTHELSNAYQQVRWFSERLIKLYRESAVADVVDMAPEHITARLGGNRGVTDLRQWKSAILGDVATTGAPAAEAVEAWEMARRHVFESMLGETTHGAGKAVDLAPRGSSATSMINGRRLGALMDRMGDDVLNELLSPAERRALTNVRIVANAMNKGGRVGAVPYTSITAQNSGIQALLTAIGGLLGAGAGGGPIKIAGGLAASLMVPPVIAKLLTSPKAVEVFASPGFGRLAMEFSQRKLSREGAATIIRLVSMAQEASGTVEPSEAPDAGGLVRRGSPE